MDYVYLKEFFSDYTLPTLIIALIVGIATLIYDRFLSGKLPAIVRSYAPFILSITLYFAFDMIFVSKAFTFKKNAFYAGVLSGSLSVVIVSSIDRIKRGKPLSLSTTAMLIESIITGYVIEENLQRVALDIEKTIATETDAHDTVSKILLNNSLSEITEQDRANLTTLIITAVRAQSKTE